jgi:DNA repair protein RecO (recombination protein O)
VSRVIGFASRIRTISFEHIRSLVTLRRYPPGMALRNDQGIVLRSYPFGEADRVVVLLSPNRGKLRTVAKGVRRTKSRFGGRLEPFTHVDMVSYEGRNLDTITQVEIIEAFPSLRADLDRVIAAGTMLEVADFVAQEDLPSLRLFLLLQRGLRALDAGPAHPDLLTAFLLKSADVVGVAPALESCAACGRSGHLHRFSFAAGGALCDDCRTAGAYALSEGLVPYLAAVAGADFPSLPDADVRFSGEAMGVARRFIEYHLERRLDTMAMLGG